MTTRFNPAAGITPLQTTPNAVELNQGSAALKAPEDKSKVKQACQDFESVFVNYLLTKMRDSVPKSDLEGQDHAEETYRSMLDEQLSKQIAASGGIGLAQMMERQLDIKTIKASDAAQQAAQSTPTIKSTREPSEDED